MEKLFSATWYRSPMELQGEAIVPSAPFEAYDPFHHYHPFESSRRDHPSLYLEFLAVNPQDPMAVLRFCERFGVLGENPVPFKERPALSAIPILQPWRKESVATLPSSFAFIFSKLNPDSAFTSDRLAGAVIDYDNLDTSKPHPEWGFPEARFPRDPRDPGYGHEEVIVEARINQMETAWAEGPQQFLPIVKAQMGGEVQAEEYQHPMLLSSFNQHQMVMAEAVKLVQTHGDDHQWQLRRDFFPIVMNRNVVVVPKIQWDAGEAKWRIALEATSLITVLWVMMMLDLTSPGTFLSCPRCGKIFFATSTRTRFCSDRCNNNYKVQQHKVRKAEREKKTMKSISTQKSPRRKTNRKR